MYTGCPLIGIVAVTVSDVRFNTDTVHVVCPLSATPVDEQGRFGLPALATYARELSLNTDTMIGLIPTRIGVAVTGDPNVAASIGFEGSQFGFVGNAVAAHSGMLI